MAESRRAVLVTVYFEASSIAAMNDRREKRKRWVQRGEYAVEVGIYDRVTSERLPVAGTDATSVQVAPLIIRP